MPALTPNELQALTDDVADYCRRYLRAMDADTLQLGMQWYDDAASVAARLGRNSGTERTVAAAVVAALSPRVRWSHNIEDANLLLAGHESGFMALNGNVIKAMRIMNGEDPDDILGGRKVRSFWQNIAHPMTSDDVTLDVWMLRALVPDSWIGNRKERYGFLARKGVYDAISDGVRQVAHDIGIRPHSLQAAIWIHVRGDHE